MNVETYQLSIKGNVQGVGFRPYVYQLARTSNLTGYVTNTSEGVEIIINIKETSETLNEFIQNMKTNLPPLATIQSISTKKIVNEVYEDFIIRQSSNSGIKSTRVLPDIATCQECLADIKKVEKYRNYFAVNCTNCGPRYSILKTVPYDRVNTSMSRFEMCTSCKEEYLDPTNRRYHAQPISCNTCGPILSQSIEETAKKIKEGKIVAIKGIGGFHIVCDAFNDGVVKRLRELKNRPDKPFALMCKDIRMVKTVANFSKEEEKLLVSREAPIVLMHKKEKILLSDRIAPGIDRIGCMLAYTPLHHLLFEYLEMPIVATSANLGDEPIIIDVNTLRRKLPFVEFVLDHNRPIINAVDDSVVQVSKEKSQILRLARGYAPKVIGLPFKIDRSILAVGANQKSTIALAMNDTIIISPHIGDLDSMEAFEYFERTVQTFKRFYDFNPELIVYDKHPGYETTKWVLRQEGEHLAVQHHLAHLYACKAEYGLEEECLGFSFDGTGYGDDGTLWGGEVFVGDKRKYHFKAIKLLGGEKAVKEPRRVALSLLFDVFDIDEIFALELPTVQGFKQEEIRLLHQAYTKSINTPLSSSVGRLFDAVASLAGIIQEISYEGQSGMICEQYWVPTIQHGFPYTIENGTISIDLIGPLLVEKLDSTTIVSMFFVTLKTIMLEIVCNEKLPVILSGGVFQNKTLLEMLINTFETEGIQYYVQRDTPVNDASIALGQAYYAALHLKEKI